MDRERRPLSTLPRRWLFVPVLALCAGALLLLRARLAQDSPSPALEVAPRRSLAAAPEARADTSGAATRGERVSPPLGPAAQAAPLDDGETPMEPHPADPARAALIPPWAAFEEVENALAKRDFEAARRQLELRRRQDPNPDEWRDFYEGLDLLRECLEAPGEASRAKAQRFIDAYRASPLRRHVRRACVAPPSARLEE